MGSFTIIGLGESPPRPDEMVTNDMVFEDLMSRGVDIKGKTGIDTEKLTGIRTRWWSKLSSTQMALEAAIAACQDAEKNTKGEFTIDNLGLVHSGGSSREYDYPACACELQGQLGIPAGIEARDISLACTSWLDGFVMAASRMKDVNIRYGLIAVGGPIGSRFNAPTSLNYCLFGDGGGAAVVEYNPKGYERYGLLGGRTISDGEKSDWTKQYHYPIADSSMEGHEKNIHQYGIRDVSSMAKTFMRDFGDDLVGIDDLSKLILLPHNANLSMITEQGKRIFNMPPERILNRVAERGNTSSASIPITLAHYASIGHFNRDDLLLMIAFGGGMSVCLALYRWP